MGSYYATLICKLRREKKGAKICFSNTTATAAFQNADFEIQKRLAYSPDPTLSTFCLFVTLKENLR